MKKKIKPRPGRSKKGVTRKSVSKSASKAAPYRFGRLKKVSISELGVYASSAE